MTWVKVYQLTDLRLLLWSIPSKLEDRWDITLIFGMTRVPAMVYPIMTIT